MKLECLYPYLEYSIIFNILRKEINRTNIKTILEKHYNRNIVGSNLDGKAYDLKNYMEYLVISNINYYIERSECIYRNISNNKNIDYLIMSNKSVCKLGKCNLQLLTKNNDLNILRGNIFYAELSLSLENHRTLWDNECISFGFCYKNNGDNKRIGLELGSIGFHSTGGIYMGSCKSIFNYRKIVQGDTIGAGIIQRYYNYYVFFTVNGKRIWGGKFNSDDEIYLGLTLDTSFPVSLNIGRKLFIYNLLENYSNELWD